MSIKSAATYQKYLENIYRISQRQFSSSIAKGNAGIDPIKPNSNKLHVSARQQYPAAAALPLPANIDPTETTRFSPHRSRDISATAILSHQSNMKIDVTVDNSSASTDPHTASYDCFGAVSLNSSMQSNVPSPFGGMHKFTHLNMPGGQWSQDSKFMSQNLHNSHYTNLRREARAAWATYDQDATIEKGIATQSRIISKLSSHSNLHAKAFSRAFSTKRENPDESKKETGEEVVKLSRKDQLKKAFKEYGSTVIIFHVGISLISLEICYLLVSGGIDLMPFIESLGLSSTALTNKIATGASTFVIAYAIHKVFAPVRISITLASTPLIVRYLRKRGFLKPKSTIDKSKQ